LKRASKRERRSKVITPQTTTPQTTTSSPIKSGVRMASSPFQSPRMVHSSYFLE
jgi:hypothetical protein